MYRGDNSDPSRERRGCIERGRVMCGILRALSAGLAMLLAGCGSYVPDILEFWGAPGATNDKVTKIAGQVVCELRRAVQTVVWKDRVEFRQRPGDPPPPPQRNLSWFVNTWAVQITLNLIIIENDSLTPGISLNRVLPNAVTTFPHDPPVTTPQSFSLGLSGTASSTATRNDKLNMFYTVKELLYGTPSIGRTCTEPPTNGDLFLQSDLKLYDWLSAAILPYRADIVNYANNSTVQNAITHDVKFQIVTSGSINPQWKLVRFSGNTNPALFAVGRDRTQELIITFGPKQGGMLGPAAAYSHQATEIGAAVGQAIQSQPAR
jgi:hypothetical protein